MSRHIQVTFDARDPQALSSFWRDVLGYVHPGPPGVDLPEGADSCSREPGCRRWPPSRTDTRREPGSWPSR
jgi:hypothetical protein